MKTIDISGMGGSYENACQKMLRAGLKYLSHTHVNPGDFYKFGESKNENARGLDAAILEAESEPSGAMYSMVAWWIFCIHQKGWDKTFKHLEENHPDRITFDWDGTSKSCPPINREVIKGLDLLGLQSKDHSTFSELLNE